MFLLKWETLKVNTAEEEQNGINIDSNGNLMEYT